MNYEVGKWYWFEDKVIFGLRWIARLDYIETDNHNTEWFYFTEHYYDDGTKSKNDFCLVCNLIGLATPAQIEQCLKAYAEKNYPDGCCVKSVVTKGLSKLDYTDGTGYNYVFDEFWFCGAWIYSKGKWAELVKEEPKSTVTAGIFDTEEDLDHEMVKFVESCSGMPTYHTIKETKLEVRGEMVSIQELIEGYQKYLDIKTIIG